MTTSVDPSAPQGSPYCPHGDGAEPMVRPTDGAAPAPHAAPTTFDVPRDTTPTFELEMLVSGATLFGLFQLPPLIEALVTRYGPHLGLFGIFIAAGVGMLGRAAVYALIACFVVHLALRAYWVALVGVHSVFPGGVRWERMRESGPIARGIIQERVRPLPVAITRFDNAASLVFATGFVLAMGTVSGILVITLAGLIVWTISLADVARPEILVLVILAPVVLAFMLLPLIDLKYGARLTGAPARALTRGVRIILSLQPTSLATLQSVLATNVDKRLVYSVLIVGFSAAVFGSMGSTLGDDGSLPGASQYVYFSGSGERTVDPRHYESLRGDYASDRAPSIQSEVIEGPYVRLFVPYRPLRHNLAFAQSCPAVPSGRAAAAETAAGRAAADAILACALRLHRPTLDGRPLDAQGFRFFVNPRTNRRGFLMLIPTAGLARGEHRISVWPTTVRGRPAPTAPYHIPFWL